ncbi:MAG: hypothetical protein LBC87_04055 [Fibromonadaceae bacterium]|jgi:hypothetical protein|nr:hypothetical protein [Fibromonadaceae bacterium]
MEPSTETQQATSQGTPPAAAVPPATPPATPAAPETQSPFQAQIAQAQKEWADATKPPEEPKPPTPAEGSDSAKKKEAEDTEYKKKLSLKDDVIKKTKSENLQLQEKLRNLESEYRKFVSDKDETSAAKTLGKYEALEEEYKAVVAREEKETFFQTVSETGSVQNMDMFREQAEYYIPILATNPAIEQLFLTTKYPYATMELLFNAMAEKGWSAENLAKQPLPTLRMWLSAVGKEAADIIDKKGTAPAAATATPPAAQPPVPPSVVATTSGDAGSEPVLKTENASMEDVIKHMRKYGGKGIN